MKSMDKQVAAGAPLFKEILDSGLVSTLQKNTADVKVALLGTNNM
jgi:hypothetical protein